MTLENLLNTATIIFSAALLLIGLFLLYLYLRYKFFVSEGVFNDP
jgi:hypothetical protein